MMAIRSINADKSNDHKGDRAMQETDEKEIIKAIQAKPVFMLIYFSNTFCSRCEVAERFLEQALDRLPTLPAYKCNVHFSPKIVELLKVTSTPSIKYLVKGEVVHTYYGIHSADELYDSIKIILKNRGEF
jgi:thioredoxin-like negative regulator of GroEL